MKAGAIITFEAAELWQQLAGFELFASFTEEERLSFILGFRTRSAHVRAPVCERRIRLPQR